MTRPAPLTPVDLDLRDFPYMGLDVVRLRDSEFAVLSTGDEFRAGVLLWAAAWHQLPAASLPNDDRLLASLAGYGRNVDDWLLVRYRALHGFVECDDGRLYHPVVAEKAIEAQAKRLAHRARTANATEARRSSQSKRADHHDVERDDRRDVERDGAVDAERHVHQGKGTEKKGKETKSSNSIDRPVVVVSATDPENPENTTTTTKARKGALQEGSQRAPLPPDWKPSSHDVTVADGVGMTQAIIGEQLLAFHAYNASKGTFSADWSATWFRWCSAWKLRQAKSLPNGSPGVSGEFKPTAEQWNQQLKSWIRNNSLWSRQLGPEPGHIGCRCPEEILRKHAIDPKTGLKLPPDVSHPASRDAWRERNGISASFPVAPVIADRFLDKQIPVEHAHVLDGDRADVGEVMSRPKGD